MNEASGETLAGRCVLPFTSEEDLLGKNDLAEPVAPAIHLNGEEMQTANKRSRAEGDQC